MPSVDRQKSVQIPDGKTRAMLAMTGTGNKATVSVKDGTGNIVKTFKLDSDSHKTEDARWPTPPAGQTYNLYTPFTS